MTELEHGTGSECAKFQKLCTKSNHMQSEKLVTDDQGTNFRKFKRVEGINKAKNFEGTNRLKTKKNQKI